MQEGVLRKSDKNIHSAVLRKKSNDQSYILICTMNTFTLRKTVWQVMSLLSKPVLPAVSFRNVPATSANFPAHWFT